MNKVIKRNPALISKIGIEKHWYYLLTIILGLSFIVYYNSFYNGLIDWDDYEYIVRNNLLNDFSWSKLFLLYQKEKNITLSLASIGVQMKFSGLNPFYLHIVNVLIHLINCVLVFLLTEKFTKNKVTALLVCAFFALQPTRVESVAWVMQRKDLLYTMFFLISALIYVKYINNEKKKFYLILLVYIFVWLSSLSKIQALVIPLVFILFDLYFGRKISLFSVTEKVMLILIIYLQFSFEKAIFVGIVLFAFTQSSVTVWLNEAYTKHRLREKIIIFVKKYILLKSIKNFKVYMVSAVIYFSGLLIIYKIIDLTFFWIYNNIIFLNPSEMWSSEKNQLLIIPTYSFIDRFFMMCYSIVFYLFQFIFPFNLSAMHPYPNKIHGYLPNEYYASAVVLFLLISVLVYLIYKNKTHRKIILFGSSFFFIAIFMVCHIIPIEGRLITADRYAYLAYFGLFLIGANFINNIIEKNNKLIRNLTLVCLGVLLTGYSVYSYSRVKVWNDSYSFWSDVLKKQPDNYYANYGLGNFYLESGNNEKAIELFRKASQLNNKDPMVYNNLGLSFYNEQKYDSALVQFSKAVNLAPEFSQGYNNRGNSHYYLKDFNNAIKDYRTAIIKWNKNTDAIINKADLELEMGLADSALISYESCIAIDSNSAVPYYKIGLLFRKVQNYQDAVIYLKKALQKNPQYEDAQKALISTEAKINNPNNDIQENSIKSKAEQFVNQGLIKAKANDFKSALEFFSKAIEIDPSNSSAYKNRGSAKGALKDYAGSIKDFDKAIELNPSDGGAYLNRGNSKYKINDMSACNDWRKAKELGNIKANDMINKYCNKTFNTNQ